MKTKTERIIRAEDVRPDVHYSNYITVEPGTAWGPRKIPDFELILIVSGSFTYLRCNSGEILELKEEEVLCIPPGEIHVFKCEGKNIQQAVIACIHLELDQEGTYLYDDYRLSPEPQLVCNTGRDPAVHEIFRNCSNTFQGFGKYRQELLNTMVKELWLRLTEYWEGGSEKSISPRMRKMIGFLEKNIDKSPDRGGLAEKFCITPEHVNYLFRKELGMSPGTFLMRMKIFKACRLLRDEGLSIKETADVLGFYDEFHFSRAFKKIMGSSPSKFKGKTS